VSPIRSGSFPPIWHRRCTAYGKEFGQKKSTQNEISSGYLIREVSEISIWVDFFRLKFLPFLGDHHGCTGGKYRFGKYFTQPEKSGPTGGVFFDQLSHPCPAACVSFFRNRFAIPVHPCCPPKKGNNIGQKKSTHAEKIPIRVTVRVSFFDPETCHFPDIPNGENGALRESLTVA
jgi:hypothetical protein